MDTIEPSLTSNHEILAQSYYHHGIKRITQKKIEIETLFQLPKNILIEREHAWDELFEKYTNMPCDSDINIKDLNSVSEKDDYYDNENNDEKNYFSKSRTPMRKHPALVQYWVETGNPPYQLIDDNKSETGSSLNEDDNVNSMKSAASQRLTGVNKCASSSSLYSSVDTAAYILSNTNVTKKSDAIAIIEGAKKLTISPAQPVDSTAANYKLSMNSSEDCIVEGKHNDICENTNKLCDKESDISDKAELINKKLILPDVSTSNDQNSLLIAKTLIKNKLSQQNFINAPLNRNTQNKCMKITDILPTLANLDKILNSQKKYDEEEDATSSDENSLFENVSKISNPPKFNRKKLYTDRNSPIDILLSTFKNGRKFSLKKNVHPALLSTPTIQSNTLFSRRHTSCFQQRRKKHLASVSEPVTNPVNEEENDGNNMVITMNNGNKNLSKSTKSTKRQKKLRRHTESTLIAKKSPRKYKRNKQRSDYTKYDDDITDHNDELSVSEKEKLEQGKKKADLIAQCSLKILKIQLERCVSAKSIPNDVLRDDQSIKSLNTFSEISRNDIHNIDDESQESESSTILICKCVNDQETNVKLTNSTGSLKEISGNTEELGSQENQNKSEIRISNVSVTTDKHVVINDSDKITTSICSELFYDSDENSSVKLSSKSQPNISADVIKFSSDEEDEFVKIIRENSKKHEEQNNIEKLKGDETNCKNLIQDLTGESNEESNISPSLPVSIRLTIVESDNDEKLISSQQRTSKKIKRSVKKHVEKLTDRHLIRKTKSIVQSCNVARVNYKPATNAIARVLQYEISSDSSADPEDMVMPTKKLKLDPSIKSTLLMNDSTEKSEKKSEKSSDKSFDSDDTTIILNRTVSPKKIRKRKIRVHIENDTNDTVITKTNDKLSKKFLSTKKSHIDSANVRKSLDKLKPSPRPTRLCPLTDSNKINTRKKSIHRDNNMSAMKSKNIIIRTHNSTMSKRNNNSTRSIKVKDVTLNDSSSDDDNDNSILIVGNKQNKKSFSINKTNKNSGTFINTTFKSIIPSILDDSSADESLKFEPRNNQLFNRNKQTKTTTKIFQTRFDDSDSNE